MPFQLNQTLDRIDAHFSARFTARFTVHFTAYFASRFADLFLKFVCPYPDDIHKICDVPDYAKAPRYCVEK